MSQHLILYICVLYNIYEKDIRTLPRNIRVQSLPDKLRQRRRDNGKPVVRRISILLPNIHQ